LVEQCSLNNVIGPNAFAYFISLFVLFSFIATMADNNDNGEDWEYPKNKTYQACIIEFMSWFHGGVQYEKDYEFSRNELLEIRPKDVKSWFADKTYGDPNYNIDRGDRPIHARSASMSSSSM
jgi:hypothetical protein